MCHVVPFNLLVDFVILTLFYNFLYTIKYLVPILLHTISDDQLFIFRFLCSHIVSNNGLLIYVNFKFVLN
jgi:hypothetical protein